MNSVDRINGGARTRSYSNIGLKGAHRLMSSACQCPVMTTPLTWALFELLYALGMGVAQDNIIDFPIIFAMVCMWTEVCNVKGLTSCEID